MQTTIHQHSEVEYELDIQATPDDLAPDIDKALRSQRTKTAMKGFRPGKVPLSLVKKLYGKAIAFGVTEEKIQKTYEAEILDTDTYDVLGQPKLTVLDYDYEGTGELHAIIRFGVRPVFTLVNLADETIPRLSHTVTDEDVDEEINRLREREADLIPSDEPAGADDYVVVDMQRLDDETGAPLIGDKQEDLSFLLSDDNIHDDLKAALLGKKPEDTFRVDLPHHEGHDDQKEDHPHTHPFEITVKEVKHRELPELDAEFVKSVTKDRFEEVDAFRDEIKTQLTAGWTRRGRELVESNIVERIVDLHPLPVPESVVDMYLDSFVEELKNYNEGDLPPTFNEAGYRMARREEAVRQARWMFVRDLLIKEEDLAVTDEDRDAFFDKMAKDGNSELSPDIMRQYYQSIPSLMEQLNQRILNEKVFDLLIDRFDVVDKDREAYDAEMETRRMEAAAAATAQAVEAAADDPAEETEVEAAAETAAPTSEEG